MGKKLTPEHLKELRELRDRCLALYDYVTAHANLGPLGSQIRDTVENAYASQDLRGLRRIKRDFDEWSRSLPDERQQELAQLLEARLAVDLRGESQANEEEVRGILARGRIRNEREYRLVSSFIEDLLERPGHRGEVSALNELLARYAG
jgi:hypothetical protein